MSDREKLIGALGKVAWAYVFFYWDINFFVVNLLPNWAGWLLIWNALLVLGKGVKPADLGTRNCFADIAATVAQLLGVSLETPGESFVKEILA